MSEHNLILEFYKPTYNLDFDYDDDGGLDLHFTNIKGEFFMTMNDSYNSVYIEDEDCEFSKGEMFATVDLGDLVERIINGEFRQTNGKAINDWSKRFIGDGEEQIEFNGKNYKWNSVEYLREVVVPYIKDGKPRGWMIDQNTGMRVRWSGVGNALFFTSPFFKNKFEPQIHSTQKPFLLWVELLMISSDKDDAVFDPFSGSCSSGIACSVCGRNYIGCEIDKDMYDKANDWLNNYDKELVKEYIGSRIRRNEESIFDL